MNILKLIRIRLRFLKNLVLAHFLNLWRRQYSFYQFNKFLTEIPLYDWNDYQGKKGNLCYGNKKIIKDFLKHKFENDSIIEHGIYFGDEKLKSDYQKLPKVIYTYGPYRRELLRSDPFFKGVNIRAVGPYIAYSKNFLSKNKFERLKNTLGKNLLVMPGHSTEDDINEVSNELIDKINAIQDEFQSIHVCMFWYDIVLNRHLLYSKLPKVQIVCAGTRNDWSFLNRLRDIIELSDEVITNMIGTHIGYIINLEKPLWIIPKESRKSNNSNPQMNKSRDFNIKKYSDEKLLIEKLFSFRSSEILQEQKEIVELYWGKNYDSTNKLRQ